MQDYELSILEQYPINVKCTRKTRGAFFCDTDQGLFLLREAGVSRRQVLLMRHVGVHLYREGNMRTDLPVANCDGEYVSTSPEGRNYILKQWFRGRECDIRKSRELLEGTANLAHLHRFMQQVPPCPDPEPESGPEEDSGERAQSPAADAAFEPESLKKEYERHNRELKKIRRFMRGQSPKGEFEMEFLRCFDGMYEWARQATEELERTDFGELWDGTPIRLLGIRASRLEEESAPQQMNLFDYLEEVRETKNERKQDQRHRKLDRALDEIRKKFGDDAVMRAAFLKKQEKKEEKDPQDQG